MGVSGMGFARALAVPFRVAQEQQFDLIVLGHKGHFLRDLGSTADRVADHADCPE